MDIQYHRWNEPQQSKPNPDTEGMFKIALDYYQRPFALMHEGISITPQEFSSPHYIRKRFWQLVPPEEYPPEPGRIFLNSYLDAVEAELGKRLRELSLAYCLHLYRRLAPGPIGIDQQPVTIGLTRAILEAAIQKYASFQLCNKIADSIEIPIDKVLGGLLMAKEFEIERNIVTNNSQLVLSDFTTSDLLNFYDLEKLAYEIWRTTAALRTTGKGAPLIVGGEPQYYSDIRSSELDFLVKNYDKRNERGNFSGSASGVVFADVDKLSADGCIFIPIYNLGKITTKDIKVLFSKLFKLQISDDVEFNFVWFPLNLREYRKAHLPFASAFNKHHGISLDAILVVIAALSYRVLNSWVQSGVGSFLRYYQRAYEGPWNKNSIRDEIIFFLPFAYKILGINSVLSPGEIENAIAFWELCESNRTNIDLAYPGPHHIFLPINNNKVFIDYAWIFRRLHDLFIGIWIPDQNFKGDALENIVQKEKSRLPTGPCKAKMGEERQIDYAIERGSHLIIVECKAVNMSIAFDRGDPVAIQYRTDNVVKRALSETDEKAAWLAVNQLGRNYDITSYEYILPVAVSPFVEFIPSRDKYFWVSEKIPRVLTPKEFENLINDIPTIVDGFNRVKLK